VVAVDEALLQVRDLRVEIGGVTILDGVSFDVRAGEILGIVGESGSGKSVTALALMGLLPRARVRGMVRFEGQDLLTLPKREWERVRGRRIAMIFQDPMTAFLPVRTIGAQIDEQIRWHSGVGRKEARARTVRLLGDMGVPAPENAAMRYPHQLSGGLRQRAMIAMALSCEPSLLIADEPTTALDVTVQAQILSLLRDVTGRGASVMLITHDMGVVAQTCLRTLVLYGGVVLEEGQAGPLLDDPWHPYTRALLASMPRLEGELPERLSVIPGQPPSPASRPDGCVFAPRCSFIQEGCERRPALVGHGEREVACVLYPA